MPDIRTIIQVVSRYFRRAWAFVQRICGRTAFRPGHHTQRNDSLPTMNMIAPRSFHGQWFISGDNQPAATGILRFEPEQGLTLDAERHRAPNPMQAFQVGAFTPPNVIRGVDSHGTPITLFGCALSNSQGHAALDQFEIRPLHALIGIHHEQFNHATFQTVNASYSLLDAWLRRFALVQQTPADGHPTFTQHPPEDISVTLPNGAQISLTMSISQENKLVSLTLSQTQYVRFTLPAPLQIQTIASQYLYPFARLLSLLAGIEVSIDGVQFPQTPPCPSIHWLHGNRGIMTIKRGLHFHEPLVPYRTVAGTLPALVARWYEYHSGMEPILNLYFTAAHNREISANTRFLLLAQALEAYHSRSDRFVNEVQPSDDFRTRRDALVGAVPEGEQQWLRDKLNFANMKTLAQRLNELITDQQASAAQFIQDTTQFANAIRWTRNYYTHFPEDEEQRIARGQGRILQGPALLTHCAQMQALFELLVFTDLQLATVAAPSIIQRAQQTRIIAV